MKKQSNSGLKHAVKVPPSSVPDEEWLSQPDAAKVLGITTRRVVWRIMGDHLVAARNSAGRVGVTRASLERHQKWLAEASRPTKAWRFLRSCLQWF